MLFKKCSNHDCTRSGQRLPMSEFTTRSGKEYKQCADCRQKDNLRRQRMKERYRNGPGESNATITPEHQKSINAWILSLITPQGVL